MAIRRTRSVFRLIFTYVCLFLLFDVSRWVIFFTFLGFSFIIRLLNFLYYWWHRAFQLFRWRFNSILQSHFCFLFATNIFINKLNFGLWINFSILFSAHSKIKQNSKMNIFENSIIWHTIHSETKNEDSGRISNNNSTSSQLNSGF